MEQLIKSRKRVREHGEVFTPAWLVKQMCDLLPPEMWEKEKTFLEPCCGTGNFLVEILSRSLEVHALRGVCAEQDYAAMACAVVPGVRFCDGEAEE